VRMPARPGARSRVNSARSGPQSGRQTNPDRPTHNSPILVTGAAGTVGAIGRNLTEMLLAKGHKVRALVRREDDRAGSAPRSCKAT
jgi:hypothetical protein